LLKLSPVSSGFAMVLNRFRSVQASPAFSTILQPIQTSPDCSTYLQPVQTSAPARPFYSLFRILQPVQSSPACSGFSRPVKVSPANSTILLPVYSFLVCSTLLQPV
jgi:hypothetical protein